MIKLSIIIPVYNVEFFLKKCVKPLLNREIKGFEILLINDGSTDKSIEICEYLSQKYNFIRLINTRNGGLSAARNIGIKNAKGEWIALIDSDDLIVNNYLDIIFKIIEHDKYDIILYRFIRFNSEKDIESLKIDKYDSQKLSEISKKDAINSLTVRGIENTAVNKVYKKNLFKSIQYPKNKYYEDIFTTYKLIDKARSIAFYDDILYFYRQRSGSITIPDNLNKKVTALKDVIEARYELSQYFIKNNCPEAEQNNNRFLFVACGDLLKQLALHPEFDRNEYMDCLKFLKNFKFSIKRDGLKNIIRLKIYLISPQTFKLLYSFKDHLDKLRNNRKSF